jgi:plasmid maintenance system killer protein
MRALYTAKFARQFDAAPVNVQRSFRKQMSFLLQNLRHPSLRAKKFDDSRNLWQARVTRDWRFYFRIEGETYILETIIPHPK